MKKSDVAAVAVSALAAIGVLVALVQVQSAAAAVKRLEERAARMTPAAGEAGGGAGAKPEDGWDAESVAAARELAKIQAELAAIRQDVARIAAASTGGDAPPSARAELRAIAADVVGARDAARKKSEVEQRKKEMTSATDRNVAQWAERLGFTAEQKEEVMRILGEQIQGYAEILEAELEGAELSMRQVEVDKVAAERLQEILDRRQFDEFAPQFRAWFTPMLHRSGAK